MYILDTNNPYKKLDYKYIAYSVCKDYNHISRYRGLRQIVHSPEYQDERFISHESSNPIIYKDIPVIWHNVLVDEVNRLDIIAQRYLGSAQYAWVIAYFNNIEDGFTCNAGQNLKIPKTVTDLMKAGQILQSVPATSLNLSFE